MNTANSNQTRQAIRDQEEQIFETASGITIEEIYDANSISDFDYDRDLNSPGEFPFTRGPYAGMYRKRIWTRRFQVGFGSPKESNERIKYLYKNGANGFVITIDLPTSYGFDSDDPIAAGEVGVTGMAISTLEDMEDLYDGFGPDSVSYALSIRPPVSSVTLAMLACVAEKKGVALGSVIGTQQNDPFYQMTQVLGDELTWHVQDVEERHPRSLGHEQPCDLLANPACRSRLADLQAVRMIAVLPPANTTIRTIQRRVVVDQPTLRSRGLGRLEASRRPPMSSPRHMEDIHPTNWVWGA